MRWFDERFGQLDHTYFEKTATGYALRSDKYNDYLKTTEYYGFDGDHELEYVINISDGRMADVYMKIAAGDFSQSMKIVFSDFGSTEIAVPDEVNALLAEYKTY